MRLHEIERLNPSESQAREGLGTYPEQVIEFESLGDMTKYVSESEQMFRGVNHWMASTDTITYGGRRSFNQSRDVVDAIRLAQFGWKEGRDRAMGWYARLEKEFRKQVRAPTFLNDVSGHEVDVPAFLMGYPEHMVDYQEAQTRAKAIHIVVDVNVRCSACGRRWHDAAPTSPEWVLVRGAAVMMLMRVLIRAGYRPTLHVTTTTHYDTHQPWLGKVGPHQKEQFLRTVVVPAHRPSFVFDMDRVMFMTAHDSFTRRLEYRVHERLNLEHWGQPDRKMTPRYGRNMPNWVGELPTQETHRPEYRSRWWNPAPDVFVPSIPYIEDENHTNDAENESDFSDVSSAITWVFRVLEEHGVELS